jgi:DNA repair exonuclease SbcCD ATPase subunit
MGDQLSNDVVKIVDDIFKKKEESEMIKATEKALQRSTDTINELTESLEAKDQELNDKESEILGLNESAQTLEARITELEEEKSTFEAEKANFETEKADIVKRAEEAELKIAEMEKDKLAEIRLSELKEAGVVAANVEDQASKVREMSDEDFSSYKEELVAIREAIIAELKAADSALTANAMRSVAAALNMEVMPNEDMVAKYRELGSQMAENIKKVDK